MLRESRRTGRHRCWRTPWWGRLPARNQHPEENSTANVGVRLTQQQRDIEEEGGACVCVCLFACALTMKWVGHLLQQGVVDLHVQEDAVEDRQVLGKGLLRGKAVHHEKARPKLEDAEPVYA